MSEPFLADPSLTQKQLYPWPFGEVKFSFLPVFTLTDIACNTNTHSLMLGWG